MYLNHYLQRRELKLWVEARMTSSTINTMPFIIEKKANGEPQNLSKMEYKLYYESKNV